MMLSLKTHCGVDVALAPVPLPEFVISPWIFAHPDPASWAGVSAARAASIATSSRRIAISEDGRFDRRVRNVIFVVLLRFLS